LLKGLDENLDELGLLASLFPDSGLVMEEEQEEQEKQPRDTQVLEVEILLEEPQSSPESNNDCVVCRRPAGKHLYYGARVCLGCRAFFRRANMNGRQERLACAVTDGVAGKCTKLALGGNGRKGCAYCRYQRCLKVRNDVFQCAIKYFLQAGMNPKWLMTDEERRKKVDKCNKAKKRTENAACSMSSTSVANLPLLAMSPSSTFTREEMSCALKIVQDTRSCYYRSVSDIMLTDMLVPREIWRMNTCKRRRADPAFMTTLEKVKKIVMR